MKKNNSKSRIYVLDDLRGIAILLVVFFHYMINIDLSYIGIESIFTDTLVGFSDYFNLGSFAVSLFFLISGFVIPMSLRGDNRVKVIKRFAIKRFFRLYPTYWFSIIFISVVIFLFKDETEYTLKQVLINFTMFQDLLKQKSIDGVFWTLMIELKFYILTTILFFLGWLKRIEYIMIVFLFLSFITLFLGYFDGVKGYFNTTIIYLLLMYLGTSFYSYYIHNMSKKSLITFSLLVVLYFSISSFFAHGGGKYDTFGYSSGTIFAIATFAFFINFKRPISKLTTFFGNISYSFYLLHQVLGEFFIGLLVSHNFSLLVSQITTFLLATLLAMFLYKFVEIKTNKFGHRFVKNI